VLEKVKFVCSKCGQEFNSQEACKTHENLCISAYRLEVSISITLHGWVSAKPTVYTQASLYRTAITKGMVVNKELGVHKNMYCREEEDESEIMYFCSKIVDEKSSFKNELNVLKDKLIKFINAEIDETKEVFNSTETKDKLDRSIDNALNRFKETGNKNAGCVL
jgi:hypothetical protein